MAELEALKKEREEAKGAIEEVEGRLEAAGYAVQDVEKRKDGIRHELEQSRRKARDIGDELSKVGVYIASHQPKRTRSGSRPQSGNSNDKLPRIDGTNSRPRSGTKQDGSKSAR